MIERKIKMENQLSNRFIGLTKKGAQDLAEKQSLVFRLIRIDQESYFNYPPETEHRTDRICVEIENGQVIKAILQ